MPTVIGASEVVMPSVFEFDVSGDPAVDVEADCADVESTEETTLEPSWTEDGAWSLRSDDARESADEDEDSDFEFDEFGYDDDSDDDDVDDDLDDDDDVDDDSDDFDDDED